MRSRLQKCSMLRCAAVALVLLSGCASAPRAAPELQLAAQNFSPSAGMSRLYVYRTSSLAGAAVTLFIVVDDQVTWVLAKGTFLMVEVPPGDHRIEYYDEEMARLYSRQEIHDLTLMPIAALPDSCYFFKASIPTKVTRVEPGEGRKEVLKGTMVAPLQK